MQIPRKKFVFMIVLLLLGGTIILPGPQVFATENKKIDLIYFPGAEPYFLKGSHDVGPGIIVEILQTILATTSVDLVPLQLPTKRFHKYLGRSPVFNQWITYGSPVWYSEQEQNHVEFSRPNIFKICHILISKKDAPDVHAIGDLFGQSLALIHGFRYGKLEKYTKENSSAGKIFSFRASSRESALQMVQRNRVNYFLSAKYRGYWGLRQLGISASEMKIQPADSLIPCLPIKFVFDKTLPDTIKNTIDQGLRDLKDSGEIDRILEKYQ